MSDGDNIKTFLNGLEDCSAVKSDDDDSVYVFLANYATELWYVKQLSYHSFCNHSWIIYALSSEASVQIAVDMVHFVSS